MNYCAIKFKFDFIDDNLLNDFFDKVKYLLNFQFNDDSNVVFIETDVGYQIEDISNLNPEDIEIIINSFFNFKFENASNVFLYKFLVLKNNGKSTLLAIIHPSIFSYTSINDFYGLFNNANSAPVKNDLSLYYEDVKNYRDSTNYDNDLNYWKNIKLNASDYVKFHNLKTNDCKHWKIEIDKESVLNFIKNQDCSIFNFYASAFSLYISRINRQKGCLLKTNISSKGTDLKTILKMDLNNECSFADYLHQFNSIYDEAVSHTKISIENYMDEDLSYYSIYDFSNLNENISIYNGEDSALTLNIYDDYLEIVYNADLFSDIYIQHMADNIKSMINNVVEFPNHLLKDVNILSDNEEKLLSDFCRGEDADVDEDLIVSRYFRRHALKNPDAIAVDDGVNQVSYGELEKSSNSIANDLFKNYNITLNSHVALVLPRTYHFPELVLALNKLGATFIPIDLIYPVKRIEHMLEISEAECIVTTKDIAGKFDFDVNIICIEDLNSDDDVDVDIVATGENLFSIMFTSGTTGLPKGVKVSNHQLPGLFESFKNIFSFSYGDLIGCYLSFSFIASYVIYLAFVFGGGCRIFNENEQRDILSLIKILKETPINSLFLPPTLAVPVLESGDIKLDYLVLAGGKLKELGEKERNTQLINFYGTTEIVFGVTKVYDFKDIKDNNLPIGRPVTNTNVYILDEHCNQMPIGVPGEICVSSDYISPGYYNNPELTKEVFVDNPYSDGENNKIMYRTGDIGFYNFDGDIEIIGREDDQLSVRGYRIESKEILNIVNSISEVENVYLDAENDTLALYYTTNAEIDINIIKEKLMDDLPSYMVPSLFMELEEIPLNMNGKIDKARLKKMFKVNSEIDIEDEVVAGVVDAFKDVLDTDLILVNDNFVELGGNSLSAMNLQILLREKFGVNISSQEIIELSTPNNIADHIKSNLKDTTDIVEIKYTFDDGCPLSESQLNVYLDEMTSRRPSG
ncbi:AMP-binding protein, partial [Methanobrevibacter sp.]|uniref:AMP-binding protein n=1 Tax=Methanobrevibacter sp. TaxID=66852 RepID=UPI00388E474C